MGSADERNVALRHLSDKQESFCFVFVRQYPEEKYWGKAKRAIIRIEAKLGSQAWEHAVLKRDLGGGGNALASSLGPLLSLGRTVEKKMRSVGEPKKGARED